MKDNFEQADLDKLKAFILVELEGQARFEFPSGRTCSGPNMGQITQIAFELRNIIQQQMDDADSDAEAVEVDEGDDVENFNRRQEQARKEEWFNFCKRKIDKIEAVWNRKLEEPHDASDDEDDLEPNHSTTEEIIDDPFAAFYPQKVNPLSQSAIIGNSDAFGEMRNDMMLFEKANYRDDTDLNKITPSFNQQEFWTKPNEYEESIDDLLAELND